MSVHMPFASLECGTAEPGPLTPCDTLEKYKIVCSSSPARIPEHNILRTTGNMTPIRRSYTQDRTLSKHSERKPLSRGEYEAL